MPKNGIFYEKVPAFPVRRPAGCRPVLFVNFNTFAVIFVKAYRKQLFDDFFWQMLYRQYAPLPGSAAFPYDQLIVYTNTRGRTSRIIDIPAQKIHGFRTQAVRIDVDGRQGGYT